MNACIVYLVDTWDTDNFNTSLECLQKNHPKYPIIAFHEASLSKVMIEHWTKTYPITFVEIEFSLPAYPREVLNKIPESFTIPDLCSFTMGYRHMCRFFSGEIFKRPELAKYKYILRLDTDSAILEPIDDVFAVMDESRSMYGFRLLEKEHPLCYEGFYETFEAAVSKVGWPPVALRKEVIYFTNFEVIDMDFFRTKQHEAVFDAMLKSGGFYIHRWGDALFRYAYVNQFKAPVHQYFFKYRHGGTVYT